MSNINSYQGYIMKQFIILLFVTSISFFITNSCRNTTNPDDNGPNIIITSHSDGQAVSGIVEIQCELSGNLNILQIELWVNGHYHILSDTSQPLVLNWSTKDLSDGPYEITIRFLDSDSIQYFSDPMTLIVDNSMFRPNPVNILSVTYNKTEMKVIWNKSDAGDFSYYSVHHYIPGPSQPYIPDIYSINDTTVTITDFNPAVENWFGVIVHDSTGYQSFEERLANEIEQPPIIPILSNVSYEDNSFNISWNKNNEDDFLFYVLYESTSSQMKHKYIAYSSTNFEDTTFTINVGANEFRFYQVGVVDYWNLSSKSAIKFTSSYPKIAFVSSRDGNDDIFKMDSDGKNVINLTKSNEIESFPQPFPNDSKILFLRNIWGTNGFGDEIFMMDEDGTNLIQLTQNGISHNILPVISPDGSKIAYPNRNGIHIIDVNSHSSNIILSDSDIATLDFSIDGENLVYTKFVSNNSYPIGTVNIDGSNPLTIKSVPGYAFSRIYFVNDNKIIYQYSRGDSSRIYIMDSDGTNLINLTPNYSQNQLINISNDKTKLIIRSGISGYLDTRIINIDGVIINNLSISTYYTPYFSSNNNKIVFYKSDWYNNEGHHNIYLIDEDGSNKIKLTEDSTYDIQPVFLHH